jgi:hypothetical protein
LVSQHSIQPLVDEAIVSMQSSTDPTPILGVDAPSDHVVLQSIQPVVEKVVALMKSSVDPTLILESVESTKVVMSMQCSGNPALLMGSYVSTDYVFIISSSVTSEQGGIPLTWRTPLPSPRMVSFDWNDLLDPLLTSYAPFKIRVEFNSKHITNLLWMKEPLQIFMFLGLESFGFSRPCVYFT